MAMWIRRYNAKCITHDGRLRATLDAIGRRHWASMCPVLPQRMPWSLILAQIIELWRCEIAVPKLAFERHKTDPLLSSSKGQAAKKGQMPQLKPKRSAMILAIKSYKQTKIDEVTNHLRSLFKSGRDVSCLYVLP
jgi:hypothetical protein